MLEKIKELLDILHTSVLAADPTKQDIVVKDLQSQVSILKEMFAEFCKSK